MLLLQFSFDFHLHGVSFSISSLSICLSSLFSLISLYVIFTFPLLLLIFFIVFNFCQFDPYLSWCVSLQNYSQWDSLRFLNLVDFPMLKKFLTIRFSNIFLRPFLFFFFFWDPYNSNVGAFNAIPLVSETVFISFHSYSALQQLFPPFCLPAHSLILLSQLLCYWFLLVYFFFWFNYCIIYYYLFFLYFF